MSSVLNRFILQSRLRKGHEKRFPHLIRQGLECDTSADEAELVHSLFYVYPREYSVPNLYSPDALYAR